MKLSTRARYALRLMVEIAKETNSNGDNISLCEVSKRTNISRRYLEQLTIALKNESLVRGWPGRGGGYCLSRSASRITVGQIIEEAIGPINIVECVLEPKICGMAGRCVCRPVYCEINDRIREVLNNLSLKSIAEYDMEEMHQ